MPFPVPHFQPTTNQPAQDPPAMIRTATRADVLWNRPVFKAPPLRVHPQAFDATLFSPDSNRIAWASR